MILPPQSPEFYNMSPQSYLSIVLFIRVVAAIIGMKYIHLDARVHKSRTPTLWPICIGVLFLMGLTTGLLAVIVYLLIRIRSQIDRTATLRDR